MRIARFNYTYLITITSRQIQHRVYENLIYCGLIFLFKFQVFYDNLDNLRVLLKCCFIITVQSRVVE